MFLGSESLLVVTTGLSSLVFLIVVEPLARPRLLLTPVPLDVASLSPLFDDEEDKDDEPYTDTMTRFDSD